MDRSKTHCPFCKKRFGSSVSLYQHANVAHREEVRRNWHGCSHCHMYYPTTRVRKAHIVNMHSHDCRFCEVEQFANPAGESFFLAWWQHCRIRNKIVNSSSLVSLRFSDDIFGWQASHWHTLRTKHLVGSWSQLKDLLLASKWLILIWKISGAMVSGRIGKPRS